VIIGFKHSIAQKCGIGGRILSVQEENTGEGEGAPLRFKLLVGLTITAL